MAKGKTGPPAPYEARYLSDKEFRSGITVDHAVDARYAWDAGIGIGTYLDGLKDGKILGRLCHGCERRLVPPRMFCEQCFRPTDEWIEVQDTGTVNTFSLAYITWDMRDLRVPDIPAVIELDGASPGIGIMHKLGRVDPDSVHTGMRVKAVWKPPAKREGSILDIAYWTPIDENGGAKKRVASRAKKSTKKPVKKSAKKPAKKKAKR
ncbi:MAG: Zn-ribbon domain-containing OB-fold protein [Actinomycetota bacterium]